MDTLTRALTLEEKVNVTAIDIRETLKHIIDCHGLSDTSATVLGRALTMAAYLSSTIKAESERVTVVIDGGGEIGKIITKSEHGGGIRGIVDNIHAEGSVWKDGRQSVRDVVGREGTLTVICDYNMKEPYTARTQLLTGEISDDFSYYYTASQQTPTAIALLSDVRNGEVVYCGGIVIQLMPGADDNVITIVEDICTNFADMTAWEGKTPFQLIDDNFGHFDIEYYLGDAPHFECACSRERAEGIVLGLGRDEALDIIRDEGRINVNCEFCNTDYTFDADAVEGIFDRAKAKRK